VSLYTATHCVMRAMCLYWLVLFQVTGSLKNILCLYADDQNKRNVCMYVRMFVVYVCMNICIYICLHVRKEPKKQGIYISVPFYVIW